jgi:hypothetical protein
VVTGSDMSQDSNGSPMYYIAEDNMPYAIKYTVTVNLDGLQRR